MVTTAFVNIWGEMVGAIAWDGTQKLGVFEYDSEFKSKKWDLSPIKMPVSSNSSIFSFSELRPGRNSQFDCFKGLPGLLADVLPDKYGNQLIDAWLAQNGRPPGSMNPVEMLCFIGSRGIGALEFEPSTLTANKTTFYIEIQNLVDIAQKMLSKRK